MRLPRSKVARLLLLTATIAVGLKGIEANSEFWVGVTACVVGCWMIVACGEIVIGDGRSRWAWSAFLIGTAAGLFHGFGPWSNREARSAAHISSFAPETGKLSWVSRALGPLTPAPEKGPRRHRFVYWTGAVGTAPGRTEVRVTTPGGTVAASQELADSIHLATVESLTLAAAGGPANLQRFHTYNNGSWVAESLDCGHLLAALAFGGGAFFIGDGTAGLSRSRRDQKGKEATGKAGG